MPALSPCDQVPGGVHRSLTFKPSEMTKTTYRVKPGTPYDLVLPYRTGELQWYVDEKLVTMVHVGQKANFEGADLILSAATDRMDRGEV